MERGGGRSPIEESSAAKGSPEQCEGVTGEGAKRPSGERVRMGVSPLPHQGVFAFYGFKLSDLVHTFSKFVGILKINIR